jgi:hypothetical protein
MRRESGAFHHTPNEGGLAKANPHAKRVWQRGISPARNSTQLEHASGPCVGSDSRNLSDMKGGTSVAIDSVRRHGLPKR